MTGELAQIIALASHGNEYLTTGELPNDFYPSNSTFKFCKKVDFIELKKSFFSSKRKDKMIADTPTFWFETLRKSGCRKLRLYFQPSADQSIAKDHRLAGLVGGGGTWLIEAVYPDYSDYWTSQWEVKDENDPDDEIWHVIYLLISKHNKPINLNIDLDTTRQKLHPKSEVLPYFDANDLPSFANLAFFHASVPFSPS